MDNWLLIEELSQIRQQLLARNMYDIGKLTKDEYVKVLATEQGLLTKLEEMLNNRAKEVMGIGGDK